MFNLVKSEVSIDDTDKFVLSQVNEAQKAFQAIKENIDQMKAELGKAGFEVKFFHKDPEFPYPFDEEPGSTKCFIYEKGHDDEAVVETKAILSDNDINIPMLGKYLALSRAYKLLMKDYRKE